MEKKHFGKKKQWEPLWALSDIRWESNKGETRGALWMWVDARKLQEVDQQQQGDFSATEASFCKPAPKGKKIRPLDPY